MQQKHPTHTKGVPVVLSAILGLSYSGRQVLSTNPTQTGLEEIHLKGLPHPHCSRDPVGLDGKKKRLQRSNLQSNIKHKFG